MTKNLNRYERLLLNMEDIIEHRIEIDKKACSELDRDWEGLYDGKCESCGRVYEAAYLVDSEYQTDPQKFPPEKGDCIPCWRKQNDLPKIDRDKPGEVIE